MIVWVDVETSGLDERVGHLLEVAMVVTFDDLREHASESVVLKASRIDEPDFFPLIVREMHEKNGLIRDVKERGLDLFTGAANLRDWLEKCFGNVNDIRQVPLAGSTVSFDRRWLRHHMPEVEALFNYRSIDVSCLTELSSRWAPSVYANRPKAEKGKPHRALDDARASIEYLRYFRSSGFVGGGQ